MLVGVIAVLASGFLLDGSLLTEGRAGSTVEGQNPNGAAIRLDLQGRGANGDGVLLFGLTPTAVFSDGRALFARAFGEADLRLDGTTTLRLRQGFGYGTADFSPLAPASPAGPGPVVVQPPPAQRFVLIQESNSLAELEMATSRRLRMTASASWIVSGGADFESRESVALGRGPQAHASLQWSATPLDTLRFDAAGSDTKYSNGLRASVANFTVGWRTRLSRSGELAFSAGPGVGRSQPQDQPASTLPYAVATADFTGNATRDLSATVGIGVEPLGDALSGEIVERSSVRALVTLGRPGRVTAVARALGSLTLTSGSGTPTSPAAGDKFLQGELGATVPVGPQSALTAGVRGAFFSRPLPGQPDKQWAAFVNWTAHLSLLR